MEQLCYAALDILADDHMSQPLENVHTNREAFQMFSERLWERGFDQHDFWPTTEWQLPHGGISPEWNQPETKGKRKWVATNPLIQTTQTDLQVWKHLEGNKRLDSGGWQCWTRKGSPVVRSDSMAVEVGAIDEEACSFHHVLCDHTQTIQNIAQLTKRKRKEIILTFSQDINPIVCVSVAGLKRWRTIPLAFVIFLFIVRILQDFNISQARSNSGDSRPNRDFTEKKHKCDISQSLVINSNREQLRSSGWLPTPLQFLSSLSSKFFLAQLN